MWMNGYSFFLYCCDWTHSLTFYQYIKMLFNTCFSNAIWPIYNFMPHTNTPFGFNGMLSLVVPTYVAPTCRRWRKAGVNWYRTNRPALGSQSFLQPATETHKDYMIYFYESISLNPFFDLWPNTMIFYHNGQNIDCILVWFQVSIK